MNFVAVTIVSAIQAWLPVEQKSRRLIGIYCILLLTPTQSRHYIEGYR